MTTPKAIPSGDIRFYNRHIPPLEAGDYTISTQQVVSSTSVVEGGEAIPATHFPHVPLIQSFSIGAPRFNLDPGEIHATFPPAGHLGAFDQNLPSVTLKGDALPWERQMNVGNEDDGTPYMAVILVRDDELSKPLTTYRASDILEPGAGILGPQLTPEFQDKLDEVTAVTVTVPGDGYSNPQVSISGGGGTGATATAAVANGVITAVSITNGGTGFATAPAMKITSANGAGFAASATIANGAVTGIIVTSGGTGYGSADTIAFMGGGGTGVAASLTVKDGLIASITVDETGEGYDSTPDVTITGGGQGAVAQAGRGVPGRAIDISTETFAAIMPRYVSSAQSEPKWLSHVRGVPVTDKADHLACGESDFAVVVGNRFPTPGPGPVSALTVEDSGNDYTSAPTVTFEGSCETVAVAQAVLNETGQVTDLIILNGGSGYTCPPAIKFSGGGGTGAVAVAQTSARWTAHLVSLEGFTNFLGTSPTWEDPITKQAVSSVRLVSFYSWSFECLSEFGNFADLMGNLAAPVAAEKTKDALLLRMPAPENDDTSDAGQAVKAAFEKGYTALEYQTRAGVNTFAWYRGPLTPLPVPKFDAPPWQNPDSAMIYDDATGLFDQSYAAGWQAGRMLALSDQKFGGQLRAWRRSGIALANLLLERINNPPTTVLKQKLSSLDLSKDDADTVAALEVLLEADVFSDAVMAYLTDAFQTEIAPHIGQSDGTLPATGDDNVALAQTKAPTAVITALKDLLAQPAVAALLQKMNGTVLGDPAPSPMSYVVNWLGSLRALQDVPFVQMVPDVRALPTESLRFFYVDPNYQKALVDGALSIGIENSQEVFYQALNYDLIHDATHQEMLQTRAKLVGQPVVNPQPDPTVPLVGCVMRSSVVAGWPGLEVKAYKTSTVQSSTLPPTPSDPILPLRVAHLAPEVLFCIFPEPPAWIEFGEPKEQLAFGFEDGGKIQLRWVSSGHAGGIGATIPNQVVEIASHYRTGAGGNVVDVLGLSGALESALTAQYSGALPAPFDSADFAIQMVRAPEQMIFQNKAAI